MRMFSITLSVWFDAHWRGNLKRSWKKRAYWMGLKHSRKNGALMITIEVFCFDIKFVLRGKDDGKSTG